jgi:hypothetical protein
VGVCRGANIPGHPGSLSIKLEVGWETFGNAGQNGSWTFMDWTLRRTLAQRYAKERHCLLLLSWLDPAHRKSTNESHEGKQTMYRLARYMHEKRPR